MRIDLIPIFIQLKNPRYWNNNFCVIYFQSDRYTFTLYLEKSIKNFTFDIKNS